VEPIIQATLPAVLFPAISLLFLAYTNRFLALTSVTRTLLKERDTNPSNSITLQLDNLVLRMELIRHMQLWGIASILASALSIGLIVASKPSWGAATFFVGLGCFVISLCLCTKEIQLSIQAIRIALSSPQNKS